MTDIYTRPFHARWGDMDFNAHMRNTAYLDLAGDVRMSFFQEHGFPMREFERLRIGPVIMRDELDYFREMRLLETGTVNLLLAGLNESGSRFRLKNEFYNAENKLVASVTSNGGWLDLTVRKIVPPPDELLALLRGLSRGSDYRDLESRSKGDA